MIDSLMLRLVITAVTFAGVGWGLPKLFGAKPSDASFAAAAVSALVFFVLASLSTP